MKTIKLILLLFVALFLVLSAQSCKDECDDVVCQNGGICNEGICDCPDGFSGTNCEIQDLCFEIICENEGVCVEGICDCPEGYIGTNCEKFDTTQVQFLLDSGKTPKELYDGNILPDSLYGKKYKGGLIFYFNTDDGTGMVAAAEDQSTGAEWGCLGTDIMGLANCILVSVPDIETKPGTRIGDGKVNTDVILAECLTDGIATRLCKGLGEDWFLPSRGELSLMYINLHMNGYGGFASEYYWSSTEGEGNFSWGQSFGFGHKGLINKSEEKPVRAAQAF